MTRYNDGADVGDVLVCSWGYDQTNVDYYKVTRRTKASVWIVKVGQKVVPGSEGFMSESVLPDPDNELAWETETAYACLNCQKVFRDRYWPGTCPITHLEHVLGDRYIVSEDRAPRMKRVKAPEWNSGRAVIRMTSYSSAYPFEGRPSYQSHYA